MPRYIDADKLGDEVDDTLNWETNNEYNMYSDIMDMIDYAPTEDVQPVVHAHWIPQYVSKRGLSDFFTCSECDKSCFTYHKVKMCSNNFCPNCGARMDGDDNAKEN